MHMNTRNIFTALWEEEGRGNSNEMFCLHEDILNEATMRQKINEQHCHKDGTSEEFLLWEFVKLYCI